MLLSDVVSVEEPIFMTRRRAAPALASSCSIRYQAPRTNRRPSWWTRTRRRDRRCGSRRHRRRRLLERLLDAHALEAMLQKHHGLLVFPIALHHHALDLSAHHAEHALGELAHGEALVAGLALELPNVLVLHVGRLGLASLLAKLVDLVGDGRLQAIHALAGKRADAVHLRVDRGSARTRCRRQRRWSRP